LLRQLHAKPLLTDLIHFYRQHRTSMVS
jgi:hypothetical protein